MNARAGITIACFCAWSFAAGFEPGLQAQTSPPPAQMATTPSQDTANDLTVVVGKSVLVDSARPISRIAVGSSDIAEATAVSPTEVMVNGKTPGETSLIVWNRGGGRQFFNLIVRPSRALQVSQLDGLRRELRMELPGQNLQVSAQDNLIFLRGTVKDLNSSERAAQIAATQGKVVNLLYVDVPQAEPQILLKVRFASVDRTLEKQLGANIFSLGATNTVGSIGTGQYAMPSVSIPNSTTGPEATISNALNLFLFRPDLNLGAVIEALETKGLVEVLAEPNVLAENGKQASFLAGGEYPYPVVQGVNGTGTGAVTIVFKEYGIRLNFIPTITPRGTIRLQVAPEVSSLDFTNAITLSGFEIPSIDVRKVRTEVELREGQSFAIGGLLDNNETQTFEKIPFLGDIPILGKFFQSMTRTKNNTELIVIITPEIVSPIPAGAPLPALKYPVKFLPPNTGIPMTNPGPEVTGYKPTPAPPTIPVEKLIQSMQPEQPLVTDQGYGSGGGMGASTGATSFTPQ